MLTLWLSSFFLLLCSSASSLNPNDFGSMLALSPNYSLHEAPSGPNGSPLPVKFSINLRHVLDVDEKKQLISLETSLRLYWKDDRIKLLPHHLRNGRNYITFNPKVTQLLWVPDIFIDKAKDIRVPIYFVKPASLRVYNDSTIRYSSRINFDVACEMDFHRYPVDKQLCEIKFESFGFTSDDLELTWKNGSSNINKNISLTQFDMSVDLMDTYATDYYDLTYPGLIMKIHLQRELGYHLVQTYVPSIVFVFVAWLSLFISPESIPGRVGMGMTTLLTLTAMFGAERNNVPKVSYVSFLDIWMVTCIIFVFLCILEFAIVSNFVTKGRKSLAKCFERFSRVAILSGFIIFNMLYWPMLFFL